MTKEACFRIQDCEGMSDTVDQQHVESPDMSATRLGPHTEADRRTPADHPLFAGLWRRRGRVLGLLDAIAIGSSFMLAYYLRFYAEFLAVHRVPVPEAESYLKGAGLLAAMWVFLVWRDGGYESGLRGLSAPMLKIYEEVRHLGGAQEAAFPRVAAGRTT